MEIVLLVVLCCVLALVGGVYDVQKRLRVLETRLIERLRSIEAKARPRSSHDDD